MTNYYLENAGAWSKVGLHEASVASTNTALQERVEAAVRAGRPLLLGTSLRADAQTAGRGRHRRRWYAQAGLNLTVSYLLGDGGLLPQRLFCMSQLVGLAVRDTVESLVQGALEARGLRCTLKWPNDVFIGDRKVAGILLESNLQADRIAYFVAGVGLNVHETQFLDLDEPRSATSLAAYGLAPYFDVRSVWEMLTHNLQARYAELAQLSDAGDVYPLQRHYHEYLLGFGELQEFVKVKTGERFLAKVLGVDPNGRLRLEVNSETEIFDLDALRQVVAR